MGDTIEVIGGLCLGSTTGFNISAFIVDGI